MSPDDQQVTKRKVFSYLLSICLISGWKNTLPALLRWEKLPWKRMLYLLNALKYTSKDFPNFAVLFVLFLYYNEYHGIWTNCFGLDLGGFFFVGWGFFFLSFMDFFKTGRTGCPMCSLKFPTTGVEKWCQVGSASWCAYWQSIFPLEKMFLFNHQPEICR